jgi:hypothetical protein
MLFSVVAIPREVGMRPLRVALFAATLGLTVPIASATDITLSGSDLLANPLSQFPNGAPSQVGTSLVFGPSPNDFAKLVVIPLAQFGVSIATISFWANLTRLTGDWDAFVTLGDGVSLLGAAAGDNNNGQGAAEVMDDLGAAGSNPNPPAHRCGFSANR